MWEVGTMEEDGRWSFLIVTFGYLLWEVGTMEEDDTLMDFEVSCFNDIFIETIFNINVGNIIYLIF